VLPAIDENPQGVIAKVADRFVSENSLASFLLRRAKIVAEGDVTYCMCLNNVKEKFFIPFPYLSLLGVNIFGYQERVWIMRISI
jgi:hypothetical protein